MVDIIYEACEIAGNRRGRLIYVLGSRVRQFPPSYAQ
jgi:hypothetical protein